ncbi:CLUMA_CG015036, isoform A [Clunio marinus]|uniref:CLUMA_CG015036, isoform A n=1 Tax=Clunio marinus TaxID=568069 RepID=A0A1J1INL2_9DIPT|nr:CLUMA_CG015036, isoform A [Clunio marinus]
MKEKVTFRFHSSDLLHDPLEAEGSIQNVAACLSFSMLQPPSLPPTPDPRIKTQMKTESIKTHLLLHPNTKQNKTKKALKTFTSFTDTDESKFSMSDYLDLNKTP